jgi:hypothetical protein
LYNSKARDELVRNSIIVRFQVLTAASMKFRVFWDVAPFNHIEVDRYFRGQHLWLRFGKDAEESGYGLFSISAPIVCLQGLRETTKKPYDTYPVYCGLNSKSF